MNLGGDPLAEIYARLLSQRGERLSPRTRKTSRVIELDKYLNVYILAEAYYDGSSSGKRLDVGRSVDSVDGVLRDAALRDTVLSMTRLLLLLLFETDGKSIVRSQARARLIPVSCRPDFRKRVRTTHVLSVSGK